MHMSLHIASHSERFTAHYARMRLLAGMYATVILQIAARSERFVTVFAAIIFLPGVNTSVHDQRVFPSKFLGAVFALILFVFRMDAHRMIFQIAPLPKVSSTIIALVWLITAVKSLVYLFKN